MHVYGCMCVVNFSSNLGGRYPLFEAGATILYRSTFMQVLVRCNVFTNSVVHCHCYCVFVNINPNTVQSNVCCFDQ